MDITWSLWLNQIYVGFIILHGVSYILSNVNVYDGLKENMHGRLLRTQESSTSFHNASC